MSSINIGDFASLTPEEQAKVLSGPALQPPDGVTSDFDHPANGTVPSHVALAIFLALITISLCGRIYVRFFTKQLFIGDCKETRETHLSTWCCTQVFLTCARFADHDICMIYPSLPLLACFPI